MLREPRGYPAANCNLDPAADPSRRPTPGYVIMEHVEYPGMSGTNTICVVTALLETGMLPMTEPVTELVLEAPAGLIRVRADVRRRQGHRRDVPQRAGVRDPPRRADRGPAAGHGDGRRRVRRDVLRDRRRRGARVPADARRGPRHHPGDRDDQGGGRASSCRSSTPSSRGSPASRSGSCRARRTTRGTRGGTSSRSRPATSTGIEPSTWTGRRSTGRRAAPARARRWRSSTRRAASRPARTSATRASSGRCSRAGSSRRRGRRPRPASCRRSPAPRWITGFASYVVDPSDPFPEGFTVGDIW